MKAFARKGSDEQRELFKVRYSREFFHGGDIVRRAVEVEG